MFFEFRFWKYLMKRNELFVSLKEARMQSFELRIWLVAIFGVFLFALQDFWGMNTESLTTLFAKGFDDTYSIARIASLVGAIIWSIVYMAFHFFGIAFLLHKITGLELQKAAVMQLFVVALLLMEKGIVFLVFVMIGYTTPYSFLSFGPLAATYLDSEFLSYFFNHLTIVTMLIIGIQFQFLRTFTALSARKSIILLVAIQIILALIAAGGKFYV